MHVSCYSIYLSSVSVISYPPCFLSWPPSSKATSDWTLLSAVSQSKCCSSLQCQDDLRLHAKQAKFFVCCCCGVFWGVFLLFFFGGGGGFDPFVCVCVLFLFHSLELPFYCPHWLPLYPTFFLFLFLKLFNCASVHTTWVCYSGHW